VNWLLKQLAPVWGWIAAGLAAAVTILAAISKAKRDGALDERTRQIRRDNERAWEIRDAVDAARRGGGMQPDDRGYRD
jgi:hypothetical protein